MGVAPKLDRKLIHLSPNNDPGKQYEGATRTLRSLGILNRQRGKKMGGCLREEPPNSKTL
jgi:hypothetical protein